MAFKFKNVSSVSGKTQIMAWSFLGLAISPFFSGLNSLHLDFTERFLNALNWAIMPLVGLILILIRPSVSLLRWSLRVICLGTVGAVIEAFASWNGLFPQINSLGHVNQSAIYLAFAAVSAGILYINRENAWDSALAALSVVLLFLFQGPARSMVGFGACVVGSLGIWMIVCLYGSRIKLLGISLVALTGLSYLVVTLPTDRLGLYKGFKVEFDYRLASVSDPYSQRDRLLASALEVGGKSLFGSGIGSFGLAASMTEIQRSVESRGGDWETEKKSFFSSSHGHNIFSNILVERGWVGVASVASFLAVNLWLLIAGRTHPSSACGVLVLILTVAGGLGQSTLHNEHGQLALLMVAICYLFAQRPFNAEVDSY